MIYQHEHLFKLEKLSVLIKDKPEYKELYNHISDKVKKWPVSNCYLSLKTLKELSETFEKKEIELLINDVKTFI